MAKSVLELAVGTGQWDAGLKKAKNALDNFTQANGGLQKALATDSDKMQQFVKMMGQMDSTAKTAKGQMNDYKGTIEQLTMQYNRMTDAQKASVGQTYLQAIDQMKQKYQGVAQEVAKINQELKQTDEITSTVTKGGGIGSKFTDMLSVAGGNLLAQGATKLASELQETVQQGIELARAGEGIRVAFDKLNRPGLLANLREATHGTVADIELMKAAVKFNDFKLPVEELGTMLAFAQQKAKDTGQSVDYMVDSIVTGLGRKSLLILDNLGLSAAQIKERMKEGGDMTKAVGEIIREEMAKAGDYVETAADRAARATAETKNKMEELGRAAMPVAEEFSQAWNVIKIGGMQLMNTVLTPIAKILKKLQEFKMSPQDFFDSKVLPNMMTEVGSNVDANGNYIRRPAQKGAAGFDWEKGTWKPGYSGAIYNSATGQTELPEINVFGRTLSSKTTPKGGGGGNTNTFTLPDFVPAEGDKYEYGRNFKSLAADEEFINIQRKLMGMDGEQTRDWGKELGKVMANYVDDPDKDKRKKTKEKEDGDFLTDFGKVTNSVTNIASGLQSMGVEIPEGIAKTLGVIQTISGILSAILAITTVISAASEANATANWLDALIPFAHGGKVPRAALGYYVPGTHTSGDVTPILANAGELVLNKSSQNNLANELKGAEALVQTLDRYQTSIMRGSQYNYGTPTIGGGILGNMKLETMITGEQIRLVLNNNGRRTGRGEYITTNFK